jgi:hypothetical protein
MLFSGFPRLTKEKRHLNRIYRVLHGGCYATEKKFSVKRVVSGSTGGGAFFQRGASMPPHRGRVYKQRPQRFGRSVGWGGEHFSSVADSLPSHRGGVLKQPPPHNL